MKEKIRSVGIPKPVSSIELRLSMHGNIMLTWKQTNKQTTTRSGPSNWNVPQGLRFVTWSAFLRVLHVTGSLHTHFSSVEISAFKGKGSAVIHR